MQTTNISEQVESIIKNQEYSISTRTELSSNLNESKQEEYSNKTKNSNSILMNMNISATNCHPLMESPVSPDYPDLIPEKAKSKISFKPKAHSSTLEFSDITDEPKVNCEYIDLNCTLKNYEEQLPDFPTSPTALKRTLKYEMPLETTYNNDISDTENDKSIYEAHLSSNLQNVTLTLNESQGNLNFLTRHKRSNKLRRVKVLKTETSEDSDLSSLDSVSESLKSENVFVNDVNNINTDEISSSEVIETLSAMEEREERQHARHWQRIVLPTGGEPKTIDMRVIEPYKRVLSHGGYLRAGGHTAIVLFSACYLPDKSRVDYVYVMDNLFLYVLWTLERLVTEDYVLIYLHGGATKLPNFSWLKRCYQMIGRRLRKNLVHLYLVHPTLWIKTILFMAKPFISSKFYRKISYINTLRDLMIRVPLEPAAIPDKVKNFDKLHREHS